MKAILKFHGQRYCPSAPGQISQDEWLQNQQGPLTQSDNKQLGRGNNSELDVIT